MNKRIGNKNAEIHGYATRENQHPLYAVFHGMKGRCYCKTNKNYNNYGNRGIVICARWLKNVNVFIGWCLRNGWHQGLQIDRIDNNEGYSPENCRFVEGKYNSWNRGAKNSRNTSGYGGVTKDNTTGRWNAKASVNGKIKYLGAFDTPILGALYRDAYILAHGALLPMNFPQLSELSK